MVLLMEEFLHQLIGSLSQVVQDFFHQQYGSKPEVIEKQGDTSA